MITVPTTLLLGAGASTSLSYPTGEGLRDAILQLKQIENPRGEYQGPFADVLGTPELRIKFRKLLSRGGWGSPDAFLEHHTEYLQVGKFLMANVLVALENVHAMFPPYAATWYSHLGQKLLTTTESEFRNNRLAIVTFNYDRSIEYFLHELVATRYALEPAAAWQLVSTTIPIVHVHGTVGEYPTVPYDSRDKDYYSRSQNIRIISEHEDKPDDFCTDKFREANSLLSQAEDIFVLGFGMADTNMQRLRFFTEETVSKRRVLCSVGHLANIPMEDLLHRVRQYGLTQSHIRAEPCESFFMNHGRFR